MAADENALKAGRERDNANCELRLRRYVSSDSRAFCDRNRAFTVLVCSDSSELSFSEVVTTDGGSIVERVTS